MSRLRFDPGWLVLLAAAALLLFRIEEPRWRREGAPPGALLHYVWDESWYSFTAHRLALGDPEAFHQGPRSPERLQRATKEDLGLGCDYETHHPPLATEFMAGCIRVFGWNEFGARIGSVLAGLAALLFSWLLARRLLDPGPARLALLLLAFDGTMFVVSRTGFAHAWLAAAAAAAGYAALRFLEAERPSPGWLLFCGTALGTGIASKWILVPLAAVLAFATAVRIARDPEPRLVGAWILGFVVVPAAIYLLAFLPFFTAWGRSWDDFLAYNRNMWDYHRSRPATSGGSTPWYSWPFLLRPVVFYRETGVDGSVREVLCGGNPLLWWPLVPATLWCLGKWIRDRAAPPLLLAAGFLVAWLPWAFLGRYSFPYFLVTGLPFGAAAAALVLQEFGRERPRAAAAAAWIGATAAVAWFAAHYGSMTGLPRPA